ncbi:MAG: precorrin-2 C(20)-methyltransferase [Pseudomonadota bacterium]
MNRGVFYGVGVGPGDPELITVRAANIISRSKLIFAPKSGASNESLALRIARRYVCEDAEVTLLEFPLESVGHQSPQQRWNKSCLPVVEALKKGEDCCFVTLGDPYIYSTYIYLVRAIRNHLPDADIVTVPGVTAFNAAASLAQLSLAEANESISLFPASAITDKSDWTDPSPGTYVVMKIGDKLKNLKTYLLRFCERAQTVFVTRAGLPGQKVLKWPAETPDDLGQANMTVILTRFRVKESS